jgi:hypothetical protein
MGKLLHFLPFILALVLAGFLAYQSTITRGYVTGPDNQPIAGADVVLADSTRVITHVRTNARGYFRFIRPGYDRESNQILICAPEHSALRSSIRGSGVIRSTYRLNPVGEDFFWTPDRIGWKLQVPPSCPGGQAGWSDSGPLASFTSTDLGGPMDQLTPIFGSFTFLLVILISWAIPLLIIAWLIRTFSHMRRDQVRMLELVSSIEAELRGRGSGGA